MANDTNITNNKSHNTPYDNRYNLLQTLLHMDSKQFNHIIDNVEVLSSVINDFDKMVSGKSLSLNNKSPYQKYVTMVNNNLTTDGKNLLWRNSKTHSRIIPKYGDDVLRMIDTISTNMPSPHFTSYSFPRQSGITLETTLMACYLQSIGNKCAIVVSKPNVGILIQDYMKLAKTETIDIVQPMNHLWKDIFLGLQYNVVFWDNIEFDSNITMDEMGCLKRHSMGCSPIVISMNTVE